MEWSSFPISEVQFGADKNLAGAPALVLNRARIWVLKLFNDHADTRLVWHSYARTNRLILAISNLSKGVDDVDQELYALYLAGWFGFTGYLFDPEAPLETSVNLVRQFLKAENQPGQLAERIEELLPCALLREQPVDAASSLLWDSALSVYFGEDYRESQSLRKREFENLSQIAILPEDWRREELHRMEALQYYTPRGKAYFEAFLINNLQSLHKKEKKALEREEIIPAGKYNTNSAVQSYLRTTYHTHIHLSAIADRKAQMLISVNAILISVLISVISYSNLAETRPALLVPVLLFLVFGLGSLIFAITSARPRVTKLPVALMSKEERRDKLLFFGHYTQLQVDQYIDEMMDLFLDGEALYRSMHRDIYQLGKVLDRKFRLVNLAFLLFLTGFISGVISFIVIELAGV